MGKTDMKRFLKQRFLLVLLVTFCSAWQIIGAEEAAGNKYSGSEQTTKRLKTLQDLAEGVTDPGVRSYALIEVARAYSVYDKATAAKLLDEAFSLTKLVPPGTGETFLEEMVCNQIVLLVPNRLDDFLYQVDPDVRRSALHLLLQRYERANQLDKAVETINRLANEDEFPYGDADRVIAKLPANSRAEKQALFGRALASYRNHQHEVIGPRNDLGLLLVHVWKEIDVDSVRDAILSMLQEAQEQAQNQRSVRISIASAKGSATLGSTYEYRLFQLLPVLREIDPSAARDLQDKYSQTKQLLGRYPDGLLSLEGGSGNGQAVIGVSSGGASLQMESPTWQQEVEKGRLIVTSAASDPAQAIDNADTLNFPFVKADTLEEIAGTLSRKDPELAKKALLKVMALGPKLIPVERAKYMLSASELYLATGDSDAAQTALEVASSAVSELYKEDSSKNDPNTALKAFWPSAIFWQRLVSVAEKISLKASAALVKSITDHDIQLLAMLALEGEKLHLTPMPIMTVTTHKAGEITYRPESQ